MRGGVTLLGVPLKLNLPHALEKQGHRVTVRYE